MWIRQPRTVYYICEAQFNNLIKLVFLEYQSWLVQVFFLKKIHLKFKEMMKRRQIIVIIQILV